MPQKEVGKGARSLFFHFRDSFVHFSVTFSDASVTFFVTFFAKFLVPDSFCGRVIFSKLAHAEALSVVGSSCFWDLAG